MVKSLIYEPSDQSLTEGLEEIKGQKTIGVTVPPSNAKIHFISTENRTWR
jgi:hypothetical protein